jgi:FtsZ-binding cell division protein ZapB
MFNNFSKDFAKLDVLESKLNIYESLSREMLDKLETAVDKISEGNSRIATILAKHDERIEQSIKTDELLVKMIDEVKQQNSKEHKIVTDRIKSIENTVADLSKFKWQAAAIIGASILVIGLIIPVIDKFVLMPYNGGSPPARLR